MSTDVAWGPSNVLHRQPHSLHSLLLLWVHVVQGRGKRAVCGCCQGSGEEECAWCHGTGQQLVHY